MIDDVEIIPLKQIPDERGKIMHMMRSDDPVFEKFGEIYFSWVYPGKVKGWHLHKSMILNYAVIVGSVKLVLYDNRSDSSTKGEIMELFPGESNYVLIKVPPGIWNGFKGLGVIPAIVANCASEPHDPDEIVRVDFQDLSIVPYRWETPYK
jgi:dTDP-4-dehydrorhamnose 3,5-epimerase